MRLELSRLISYLRFAQEQMTHALAISDKHPSLMQEGKNIRIAQKLTQQQEQRIVLLMDRYKD